MQPIHKSAVFTGHQQRSGVGHFIQQRIQPFLFRFCEIIERISRHGILATRVADAKSHASEFRPEMRLKRSQSIMTRSAAAELHPHFAGRQVDFIMKDNDVG